MTASDEEVSIVMGLDMGGDEEITKQMNLTVLEGRYPASEQEALIDQQALRQFGIAIGDTIEVPLADGSARAFKITGVYGEFSMLSAEDAHGLFLTAEGIRAIGSEQFTEKYYVQFKQGVNIRKALAQMQAEYGLQEAQVTENIRLLGLLGQSSESAITQLYLTAGSFALSIILLLSFTVLIVFMKHAINPLEPYAADLSVTAADGEQTIDKELAVKLRALPHIKALYGRMFAYDIPASLDGQSGTVTLVSYDEKQFEWAEPLTICPFPEFSPICRFSQKARNGW